MITWGVTDGTSKKALAVSAAFSMSSVPTFNGAAPLSFV